jgi:hypothetical protein
VGWRAHFVRPGLPTSIPDALVYFAGQNDKALTGDYPRWQLTEPRPPTPPPYHQTIGRASLSTGGFPVDAMLLEPDETNLKWREVRGWPLSALEAVGLEEKPIERFSKRSTPHLGYDRMITKLAGWGFFSQQFDWAHGEWVNDPVIAQGFPDGIDVTIPAIQASNFDFATNGDSYFSVHLTFDQWFPGEDRWLTNGMSALERPACGSTAMRYPVALNVANVVDTAWCPRNDLGLDTARCPDTGFLGIRKLQADYHWPRLKTRVPMAAIYGQIDQRELAAEGHFTFGGDFSHFFQHQGIDINWIFPRQTIDPAYRGVIADRKYCMETDVAPRAECYSNDPTCQCSIFGQGARCLPPCNRPGIDCPLAPRCGSNSDPFGAACGWPYMIDCSELPLNASTCTPAEFATGCDLCGKGVRCSPGVHITVQVVDPHPRIDNELEYNVTFGARPVGGLYPIVCGDYLGAPSLSGSCDLHFKYEPPNWLFGPGRTRQLINTNLELMPGGDCNPSPFARPEELVWPYTVAPGIFQDPRGIFGNYATVAGETTTCPEQKRVLTHGLASNEVSAEEGTDRGFRIEFLGDLILDCGHDPHPSEIHPPEAILLHLSRPGDPRARYSLFGWHRFHHLTGNLTVELWPNGVAGSADASLTADGEFFGDGGQIGGILGPAGKWNCMPVPAAAPNRLRCTLTQGPNIVGLGFCDPNNRMLPGCAMDVAGGLVNVQWTP